MNIVYVYADSKEEWNCSEWRCAVPSRAIQRTGLDSANLLSIQDFVMNTPLVQNLCEQADVIVIQRNFFGPVLEAIQHWKVRDKVIIGDFDDAYNLMPASVKNYSFWQQGLVPRVNSEGETVWEKIDPPPLTQFKWGLQLVHAATVPSKRLADDWSGFTKVHYLPNYIDLDKYVNVLDEPHEGVILGWGGSLSHLQSFTGSGVLKALKRVCQLKPQVKVMINGGDRRIFDKLPIPPEQKILRPWVRYRDWPKELALYDIGLAPLFGPYDERRSWVKVLEYMVMKIPWIASEGPPYHELQSYGWLVRNSPTTWERLLIDMIDHLDEYKAEAAREPYLYGISQSITANVDKVVATYTSILNENSLQSFSHLQIDDLEVSRTATKVMSDE